MRRGSGAGLAIVLMALACASGRLLEDLERDLARRAAEAPAFSPRAAVIAVPVESQEAGWQELVRVRSQGPSPLSNQLGRTFAGAPPGRRDFVVGGPHAALTDRVLRDGLTLSREPRLPGLRVLLVSPEPPSDALRGVAEALEVELLYRPLRGEPGAGSPGP